MGEDTKDRDTKDDVGRDPTGAWHVRLHRVRHGELSSDTAQTAGMQRFEAVSDRLTGSSRVWMGETHVRGGTRSADHHHGDSETGIYVVSGNPVFVFAEGGDEVRLETEPGDYIFVPPFLPHREENPGSSEAVVVIARSSQQAIVVNLPSLFAPPAGASARVRRSSRRA